MSVLHQLKTFHKNNMYFRSLFTFWSYMYNIQHLIVYMIKPGISWHCNMIIIHSVVHCKNSANLLNYPIKYWIQHLKSKDHYVFERFNLTLWNGIVTKVKLYTVPVFIYHKLNIGSSYFASSFTNMRTEVC